MKIEGKNVVRLDGAKIIYTLLPGDKWTLFNGDIIVINKDNEPKVIKPNGEIQILRLR